MRNHTDEFEAAGTWMQESFDDSPRQRLDRWQIHVLFVRTPWCRTVATSTVWLFIYYRRARVGGCGTVFTIRSCVYGSKSVNPINTLPATSKERIINDKSSRAGGHARLHTHARTHSHTHTHNYTHTHTITRTHLYTHSHTHAHNHTRTQDCAVACTKLYTRRFLSLFLRTRRK